MHRPTLAFILIPAVALTAFIGGRAVAGGIPSTNAMTYSGVVEDATGLGLSGQHDIEVAVYDAFSGGAPLCSVPSATYTLEAGRFEVSLPDACTDAVQADPDLWIGATVDGVQMGRTKLSAVPYAVEAAHAVDANRSAETDALAPGASGGLQHIGVVGGGVAASPDCSVAYGAATVDCTCPAGTYVVSGGGWIEQGFGHIRESRPNGTSMWRVTCNNGTNDVLCGGYDILCSRLGP